MFVVCIGGGGKPVHVVVRKGSEDLRHAFARLSEVRASGLFSARAAREKCGMYYCTYLCYGMYVGGRTLQSGTLQYTCSK